MGTFLHPHLNVSTYQEGIFENYFSYNNRTIKEAVQETVASQILHK